MEFNFLCSIFETCLVNFAQILILPARFRPWDMFIYVNIQNEVWHHMLPLYYLNVVRLCICIYSMTMAVSGFAHVPLG